MITLGFHNNNKCKTTHNRIETKYEEGERERESAQIEWGNAEIGRWQLQKAKIQTKNNLRHYRFPLFASIKSFSMIGHISGLFYRSPSLSLFIYLSISYFYYIYSPSLLLLLFFFFFFFCSHSFHLFSYLKGNECAIILHRYETKSKRMYVCLV